MPGNRGPGTPSHLLPVRPLPWTRKSHRRAPGLLRSLSLLRALVRDGRGVRARRGGPGTCTRLLQARAHPVRRAARAELGTRRAPGIAERPGRAVTRGALPAETGAGRRPSQPTARRRCHGRPRPVRRPWRGPGGTGKSRGVEPLRTGPVPRPGPGPGCHGVALVQGRLRRRGAPGRFRVGGLGGGGGDAGEQRRAQGLELGDAARVLLRVATSAVSGAQEEGARVPAPAPAARITRA